MIYGYARVSTWKQGAEGNSLEDQTAKLKEAGAEEVIYDVCTGTTLDRPELTKLLARLKKGDTLIVTKLDRFARTVSEGSQAIEDLFKRGININILNMGVVDNSPIGKLSLNIVLSFAEFERTLIIERTQSGKALARERGVRVDGRPEKYSKKQMQHALELLNEHSYNEVADITGISKSTLIRAVRKQKAAKQKEGALA